MIAAISKTNKVKQKVPVLIPSYIEQQNVKKNIFV